METIPAAAIQGITPVATTPAAITPVATTPAATIPVIIPATTPVITPAAPERSNRSFLQPHRRADNDPQTPELIK